MRGYSDRENAREWSTLAPDVLHLLLTHSDYDGSIAWQDARALADRLEELLPLLPNTDDPDQDARLSTRKFIRGLRRAAGKRQEIQFA
jgi:hypothetical protein